MLEAAGNPLMTQQHRHIVSNIDSLIHKLNTDGNHEIILKKTAEILHLFQTHFTEEERLMSKYEFPRKVEHKATHDKLAALIEKYYGSLIVGDRHLTSKTVAHLRKWLTNHIADEDGRYYRWQDNNPILATQWAKMPSLEIAI